MSILTQVSSFFLSLVPVQVRTRAYKEALKETVAELIGKMDVSERNAFQEELREEVARNPDFLIQSAMGEPFREMLRLFAFTESEYRALSAEFLAEVCSVLQAYQELD